MIIPNQQCSLCKTNVGKYTCPKCNIYYCSQNCFRSKAHEKCSEQFYYKEIKDSLRSISAHGESKKSCEEILMRNCGERREFDFGECQHLWDELSEAEKRGFAQFVERVERETGGEVAEPWWAKKCGVEVEGRAADIPQLSRRDLYLINGGKRLKQNGGKSETLTINRKNSEVVGNDRKDSENIIIGNDRKCSENNEIQNISNIAQNLNNLNFAHTQKFFINGIKNDENEKSRECSEIFVNSEISENSRNSYNGDISQNFIENDNYNRELSENSENFNKKSNRKFSDIFANSENVSNRIIPKNSENLTKSPENECSENFVNSRDKNNREISEILGDAEIAPNNNSKNFELKNIFSDNIISKIVENDQNSLSRQSSNNLIINYPKNCLKNSPQNSSKNFVINFPHPKIVKNSPTSSSKFPYNSSVEASFLFCLTSYALISRIHCDCDDFQVFIFEFSDIGGLSFLEDESPNDSISALLFLQSKISLCTMIKEYLPQSLSTKNILNVLFAEMYSDVLILLNNSYRAIPFVFYAICSMTKLIKKACKEEMKLIKVYKKMKYFKIWIRDNFQKFKENVLPIVEEKIRLCRF